MFNKTNGESSLVVTPPNTDLSTSEKQAQLIDVAKKAQEKIAAGLARPTASTGTPMENIHGGPRTTTLLSNIGGGSKETGGGGMEDGLKTLLNYANATGQLSGMSEGEIQKGLDAPEDD